VVLKVQPIKVSERKRDRSGSPPYGGAAGSTGTVKNPQPLKFGKRTVGQKTTKPAGVGSFKSGENSRSRRRLARASKSAEWIARFESSQLQCLEAAAGIVEACNHADDILSKPIRDLTGQLSLISKTVSQEGVGFKKLDLTLKSFSEGVNVTLTALRRAVEDLHHRLMPLELVAMAAHPLTVSAVSAPPPSGGSPRSSRGGAASSSRSASPEPRRIEPRWADYEEPPRLSGRGRDVLARAGLSLPELQRDIRMQLNRDPNGDQLRRRFVHSEEEPAHSPGVVLNRGHTSRGRGRANRGY
jgi:hypothetical protein